MSALNVQLDAEDAARVAELRRRGVKIDDVLRRAIRAEHARLRPEREPLSGEEMVRVLEELDREHPLPPLEPGSRPDLTDRRAVQKYIRDQLEKRRPRA